MLFLQFWYAKSLHVVIFLCFFWDALHCLMREQKNVINISRNAIPSGMISYLDTTFNSECAFKRQRYVAT